MPRNNRAHRKRQQPKARRVEFGRAKSVRPGRLAKVESVRVRSQLREEVDVRRLARAVIRLALEEADARQRRDGVEGQS